MSDGRSERPPAHKPPWVQRWEAERAAGGYRYVVRVGVFQYGLLLFSVISLGKGWAGILTFERLVTDSAFWAATGAVIGAILWSFGELRYRWFLDDGA